MKMEEEQMDLIVGVDFGMTCTGKTSPGIPPVTVPKALTPVFPPGNLTLILHLDMTDQHQQTRLFSLDCLNS